MLPEIERDIAEAATKAITALETLCTLGFEAEEQLKGADEFARWFKEQIKDVVTAFNSLREIAYGPKQWVT